MTRNDQTLTSNEEPRKINPKGPLSERDFLSSLRGQLISECPVARIKALRMVDRRLETLKGKPDGN